MVNHTPNTSSEGTWIPRVCIALVGCVKTKSPSPSRQRVAVNAEGRFLAHWDEFVEHRKEVFGDDRSGLEMDDWRTGWGLGI